MPREIGLTDGKADPKGLQAQFIASGNAGAKVTRIKKSDPRKERM